MRGGEHNDHEELTLLELVLPLHGEFRKSLEPIRVTPLWQGVIFFLCRHADAKLTDTATLGSGDPRAGLQMRVTKRRARHADRSLCLRLSRRGYQRCRWWRTGGGAGVVLTVNVTGTVSEEAPMALIVILPL
jgi:hypothetical protein